MVLVTVSEIPLIVSCGIFSATLDPHSVLSHFFLFYPLNQLAALRLKQKTRGQL